MYPTRPSGSPVPYGGKPAFRTGLTSRLGRESRHSRWLPLIPSPMPWGTRGPLWGLGAGRFWRKAKPGSGEARIGGKYKGMM